jgi:hypothetical protein
VVCSYPVTDIMGVALRAPFPLRTRSVTTGAERSTVVDAMTWAPRSNRRPRPCTAMAGKETAYLVGAAYGDAIVWVAAKADANACSTASNGDFVAGAPLGVLLDETLGTQRRPTVAEERCRTRSWGRLGDDRSLAPDGGPTVVVCRDGADGAANAKALDAGQSAEVVTALRALGTRPTDQTCQGSGRVRASRFTLVLRYAVGPPVSVRVDPDCAPSVMGSNLESDDAGKLVDLVEQWSPPIPGPDPDGSVSSDGAVVPAVPPVSPVPPLPAPDQPTEVPGSPGGGFGGSTGMEPAPPSDLPLTR